MGETPPLASTCPPAALAAIFCATSTLSPAPMATCATAAPTSWADPPFCSTAARTVTLISSSLIVKEVHVVVEASKEAAAVTATVAEVRATLDTGNECQPCSLHRSARRRR